MSGNGSATNQTVEALAFVNGPVTIAINVLVFFAATWILLSMIRYGRNTKKWRNTEKGRMYIAHFVTVASALPRFILTLILVGVTNLTDGLCNAFNDWISGLGFIVIYLTYLCLWRRQRSLYNNSALEHLYRCRVNVFSWAIIAALTVAFSATSIFSISSTSPLNISYSVNEKGCVIQQDARDQVVMLYFVVTGLMAFAEISLLSLFIYPLVQHFLRRRKIQSQPNMISSQKVLATVRRPVVGATITIVSDILILTLSGTVMLQYPVIASATLHNVGILVNHISILGIYEDFKMILTGLISTKSRQYKRESERVMIYNASLAHKKQGLRDLQGKTCRTDLVFLSGHCNSV